jgi:fatty-acyl-CoA synthase
MLGVVNHPRWGEIDVSGLKSVLAVGAPDTLRRLQAAVPDAKLVSTFGMTESAGCAVISRIDDPYELRMETAGGPLPGLEVRTGEDGEILLRGPLLFDGYHGEPSRDAGDWFHTGDQGVMLDGRLAFRGRLKDMLRVGGENVAPAQIEACLMAHPAVQMAAVVGRPDERLDEVPYAFVELRGDATEAELIEHCRASLAGFKVPRRVRFVEQWPMSATKIQKFRLRERMEDEHATMHGLVDNWARRTPDAPAAIFPAGTSTYAELAASSRRSAAALHAAGIRFGDRIGVLLLEGSERYLSLVLGAARLGAIAVPLNARFKTRELGYVMRHAGLKLLYTDASFASLVRDSEPPQDCTVVVAEDDAAFWVPDDAPEVEVSAGDPGLMLYTSGTTANPKGCVHSHRAMVCEGDGFAERCAVTADDRFWTPLPFFHIGGWCTAYTAFARGAALVHVGLFEAGAAVEQLSDTRATIAFPAFETIWLHVLQHPRFPAADVSALRLVLNVGVPERLRMMQEMLPSAPQVSCTGSTEAGGFLCVGKATDSLHSRTHTNGRPLIGMEIRVIDHESGAETPVGGVGELQFRGPMRFLYYHDDPEATAATIDAEGYFHTGDLVSREPDGAVGYVGRIKDMLKVGGENVAAAEIESFLLLHPAVHMCQVVGAPDARYAEVPAAFVILKPGMEATEQELIEHCLGEIATFKVPRYVRFVEEWPMSGTKIQKFKLRERIVEELAAAGITEAPRMKAPVR